jgi:hypothetical protein
VGAAADACPGQSHVRRDYPVLLSTWLIRARPSGDDDGTTAPPAGTHAHPAIHAHASGGQETEKEQNLTYFNANDTGSFT